MKIMNRQDEIEALGWEKTDYQTDGVTLYYPTMTGAIPEHAIRFLSPDNLMPVTMRSKTEKRGDGGHIERVRIFEYSPDVIDLTGDNWQVVTPDDMETEARRRQNKFSDHKSGIADINHRFWNLQTETIAQHITHTPGETLAAGTSITVADCVQRLDNRDPIPFVTLDGVSESAHCLIVDRHPFISDSALAVTFKDNLPGAVISLSLGEKVTVSEPFGRGVTVKPDMRAYDHTRNAVFQFFYHGEKRITLKLTHESPRLFSAVQAFMYTPTGGSFWYEWESGAGGAAFSVTPERLEYSGIAETVDIMLLFTMLCRTGQVWAKNDN